MAHTSSVALALLVGSVLGLSVAPADAAQAHDVAPGTHTPWHQPLAAYRDAPVNQVAPHVVSDGTTSVTVTPSEGTTDSRFTGSGSGFTPNSAVTIKVLDPDGTEYTAGYTKSRSADASGAFTWAWVWDPGDPLGTYTYVATDVSGASAQVPFTIDASTGPPAPEPGSTLMFDAASAPDLATMQAWYSAAPYRTVGVYVPVDPATDDRHDKTQANLTADWVAQNTQQGWSVLPIYLGQQAPASCFPHDFHHMSDDPAQAREQGLAAAHDAAGSVAALGISEALPVVYDLEPYGAGCTGEVAAFLDGWSVGLHAAGRRSGVYSTQTSGMADLDAQRSDSAYTQPDVVWVASDSRTATTTGFSHPTDGEFAGERMNQFRLDVERTYAGITLDVDESAVNDGVLHGTAPVPTPPTVAAWALPTVSLTHPTAAWSGRSPDDAALTYDVRLRAGSPTTALSGWTYPAGLQATSATGAGLGLRTGGTACFAVRAHNASGGTSDWSPQACTTSPLDDRVLSGSGWHHQKQRSAYRGTLTGVSGRGHVLRLPRARAQRVGVLLSGTRGARVQVRIGSRSLGVLTVGRRPGLVWSRRVATTSGALTLTTLGSGTVDVDGVAVPSVS